MSDSKKTALVTGASGGIGAEIAKKLAAQGVKVCLSGRNQEKLEALSLMYSFFFCEIFLSADIYRLCKLGIF